MDSNKKVIRGAFKDFRKQMDVIVQNEIFVYAQNIIYKAIDFRKKNPRGHDYTGNFINSIVAAVYNDKQLKKAFFSAETGLKEPRYYEMTASHGRYFLKYDYEGRRNSVYTPTIETLQRKGLDDAYEFVSTYNPDMDGFVVAVAYTTAYADWIEIQRSSTGFLSTMKYAEKAAIKMFNISK